MHIGGLATLCSSAVRVYENRVLRKPRDLREEIKGEWRKAHN
jgi:hypothetical protein